MADPGLSLTLWAPGGLGEVRPGDDLTAMVLGALGADLRDGDVVVVTSKVVSKAEGRTYAGTRDDVLPGETVRVVARRGPTAIVVNRLGLVMAAAGIDASNVTPGTVLLLPEDPDASAQALREGLRRATGRNVAVVVSDTAGRAWRTGQTDLAIGVAGLVPLDDHAGRVDGYGNALAVTAPAVADEVASAAELTAGKLGGRPLTRVRGLAERVLPPDDHGPGAGVLQRPAAQDMFALGAREAVLAALARDQPESFGAPASSGDALRALRQVGLVGVLTDNGVITVRVTGAEERWRLELTAYALGWVVDDAADPPVLRPRGP